MFYSDAMTAFVTQEAGAATVFLRAGDEGHALESPERNVLAEECQSLEEEACGREYGAKECAGSDMGPNPDKLFLNGESGQTEQHNGCAAQGFFGLVANGAELAVQRGAFGCGNEQFPFPARRLLGEDIHLHIAAGTEETGNHMA